MHTSDHGYVCRSSYEEELSAAFADLDTDSSGHIDPQNLKDVMSRFGTQLNDEEAKEMVSCTALHCLALHRCTAAL